MQKNDKTGIYSIRSLVDGRVYVGSSVQIYRRWTQHRTLLRKGIHHSPHLQNAWTKYGEAAFEFIILEECSKEMLFEREQFYLDQCSEYFNCAPIAGSRRGVPQSNESKEKSRLSALGHPVTSETREKIRQATLGNQRGLGHVVTDEHKAILSEKMQGNKNAEGKVCSPETREKIAAAQRGVPRPSSRLPKSEETKRKMSVAAKERAARQKAAKLEIMI